MGLFDIFRRPAQIEQPPEAIDESERWLDLDRQPLVPHALLIARRQEIGETTEEIRQRTDILGDLDRRRLARRVVFQRWRLGPGLARREIRDPDCALAIKTGLDPRRVRYLGACLDRGLFDESRRAETVVRS